MRVVDHVVVIFLIMKYYADYYNERVYSVAPNGDAVCKRQNILTNDVIIVKFKRPNDEPWRWEENGVGAYIEPMTADEFESFGKKWIWNETPNDTEQDKHSWRNYIKRL